MKRWAGRLISGVVVAWAAVAYTPAVLAFPYRAQVGAVTVHAPTPIDANVATVVGRADRLLAASPWYDARVHRDLFLTDGGWRWTVLAATARGAFALRRPFSSALVVNRSNIVADRVWNGQAIAGERTVSGVLAHESTHLFVARHLGELRALFVPSWKSEGYADLVARESSLSDADAARLRANGARSPALTYYDAPRRVEKSLRANGGDVDALFR